MYYLPRSTVKLNIFLLLNRNTFLKNLTAICIINLKKLISQNLATIFWMRILFYANSSCKPILAFGKIFTEKSYNTILKSLKCQFSPTFQKQKTLEDIEIVWKLSSVHFCQFSSIWDTIHSPCAMCLLFYLYIVLLTDNDIGHFTLRYPNEICYKSS